MKYVNGIIYVNGLDLNDNKSIIKKDISFCYKNEILYDFLTVEEQLELYIFICIILFSRECVIRSVPSEEQNEMIMSIIEKLQLDNCKNNKISSLCESDKRKVSVGLSLIGNKYIIVFDQPTEGMNDNDKEITWNVIRQLAVDRIVIVSTNSIIEANELSDEIYEMQNERIFKIKNGEYPKEIIQEEEEEKEAESGNENENENEEKKSYFQLLVKKNKKFSCSCLFFFFIVMVNIVSGFYYVYMYIYYNKINSMRMGIVVLIVMIVILEK